MKNLSIVLNIVLIIAVAILYVLHFSGGKDVAEQPLQDSTQVIDLADLPIAYVNTDSVLKNYKFFVKLSEDYEKKQKKAESNLQSRADGLQREVNEFQNNARNMTQNQALAIQENLQQKQQNLMMYEQTLRQDLMKEEAKMTDDLYKKITEYLNTYGRKNNLQLVLTYTRGSGVLFAHDSLDITNEVINGLNTEYESGLATNKTNAKDTTKAK